MPAGPFNFFSVLIDIVWSPEGWGGCGVPLGPAGLLLPLRQRGCWAGAAFLREAFVPSNPADISNDTHGAVKLCAHFLRTKPFDLVSLKGLKFPNG